VSGGVHDVYPGELRARHETDLAFRIGGKLLQRQAEMGMTVRRGQVLARLDPQDTRLAADAARAQVAAAESELAFARAELDRNADLLSKNFISKAVFDNKQNAYSAARARLDQARAQAGINLNQASYSALIADSDGVITQVLAEAGQVVNAGQAVFRLARSGEREITIAVPESKLAQVKVGSRASISLWSLPGNQLAGQVREINGAADPVTRTYAVKVRVDNLPVGAQLGMSANVAIDGAGPSRIIIPLAALTKTAGANPTPAVWLVDRNTRRVTLQPVVVGSFGEQGATIMSGLRAGQLIVTAGAHKLLPNQEVRLAENPLPERALSTARPSVSS
jgi:multidrug efflux system membrane fusion protein